MKSFSPIISRNVLQDGGVTSPTIILYQRANGRCRLYWQALDPKQIKTLATFQQKDWKKAQEKAAKILTSQ